LGFFLLFDSTWDYPRPAGAPAAIVLVR